MARWLIVSGLVLVFVGILWPWIARLGLGHLPGDISIERKGFGFYFPITTSLLVSILLSLIFWFFRK